jgi:hypothetical protein
MKRKQMKKRSLPKGMYELYVKGRKTPLIVQLKAIPMQLNLFDKPIKETHPEEGHNKFYVICVRLAVYTVIGADNRHHASNKATKLFGPNWSQVRSDSYFGNSPTYVNPKEFKELLKTLPN